MTEQTTNPKASAKSKTATTAKETASRFSMPFAVPTFDLPKVDLSRFDPRELDVNALASTAKGAAVTAKSKATAVSIDVRKNIAHTVTLLREAVGI